MIITQNTAAYQPCRWGTDFRDYFVEHEAP